MTQEISDVQAGSRKGRGTRDQIANICWIIEKAREFQKNIYFCFIDYSLWLCGSQQTGKFWKRWEYQTTLPASWELCMQVKKQQLEPDLEQQTGSKLGKEYVKAIYCHPAYLTYIQTTSCKKPGWTNRKLESRLQEEIAITSDNTDDITLIAESKEELKSLLMKEEEGGGEVAQSCPTLQPHGL